MIGNDDDNIILIDYGFSDSFIDNNGKHIKQIELPYFRGNTLFSSCDQLKFYRTSRKDDMISLCYVMFFMLNNCKMPLLQDDIKRASMDKQFYLMQKFKEDLKFDDVIMIIEPIISSEDSNIEINQKKKAKDCLKMFTKEILKLNYEDNPNYDQLIEHLQ